MAYDLGTAEGKIVIDSSGVDQAVAGANASLGKLGRGSKFDAAAFGSAMTLGVTAPIVAVGAASLKTAIDFESAFSDVEKTVDGTAGELDTLRTAIIDMANEAPASREEIAGVAAAAGQLGVAVTDIEAFTDTMIQLGVATNLTADDAATNIARIQNIMGSGVDTVDNFGSALVDLGNNSATTEADILNMTNRLAGIANQTNISEASMLGIAAAMSSVGIRAEAGGTAMTKTLKDMDAWTRGIQKAEAANEDLAGPLLIFSDLIGATGDELAAMNGEEQLLAFVGAMQEFEAQGGNTIELLEQLEITEIRQSDSLLKLIGSGDLLQESIARGNTAWEENNALQEETAKKYATTAAQLEIAKNNATNVLRILGEAFIPVLRDMTEILVPLAQSFGSVAEAFGAAPEPIRKLVAGILVFLAAIGPVFFVGAKIAKTVGTITSAFKLLGLTLAVNPFVLIVLAIIALVAAFVILYKRSEKFRNFINGLGKSIEKAFRAVVDFFKSLPKQFSQIWDKITGAFEAAKDAIIGAFNGVVDWFKDLPGLLGKYLKKAAKEVGKVGGKIVDEVFDFLKKLPKIAKEAMTKFIKAHVDFLTKLPKRFAYWLGFAIGSVIRFHLLIIQKTIAFGKLIIEKTVGFLSKLPGLFAEWFVKIFNAFVDFFTEVIERNIRFWTDFVTGAINKLTEFVTWLPGFLLGIFMQIVNWGVDLVANIIRIGTEFVSGLINAIIGLPGQVAGIIVQIITSFPGWAADFFSGALSMGQEMVSGLISGVGDLVGLVKDMVLGAINGVGDLASTAYNKMKDVGSSMWNGFKSGLGISSPSYIEEAVFAMNENVDDSIGKLGQQVRSLQNLSRTMPGMSQNDQFGTAALASASRAAGGTPGTSEAAPGRVYNQNAPLIQEATIRDDRDIYELTYELSAEQDRRSRGRGD